MAAMRATIVCCSIVFQCSAIAADPLEGRWITTDSSGQTTTIELSVDDGVMTGRIVSIRDQRGKSIDPICERCDGDLKGRHVVGAAFIRGLRKSNEKWTGGKVVDLRDGWTQGVVANCEITVVDGRARIFGYLKIRLFGASHEWARIVTDPAPSRPSGMVPLSTTVLRDLRS